MRLFESVMPLAAKSCQAMIFPFHILINYSFLRHLDRLKLTQNDWVTIYANCLCELFFAIYELVSYRYREQANSPTTGSTQILNNLIYFAKFASF